jgi:sugar lactone lactonase YvrE
MNWNFKCTLKSSFQLILLSFLSVVLVACGSGRDNSSSLTTTFTVSHWAGSTAGSLNGQGSAAQFNAPIGIAANSSGTVYVSDANNSMIRQITSSGLVTTFAGVDRSHGSTDGASSVAKFNFPFHLTTSSSGVLYLADLNNHMIRQIDTSGNVVTIAGSTSFGAVDGASSVARFKTPKGVVLDASGNLYVADTGNRLIRKIDASGVVTTFAGNSASVADLVDGQGSGALFRSPSGIAIDSSGNLYVTDSTAIRKISSSGSVTTLAGGTDSGQLDGQGSSASFTGLDGGIVLSNNYLYVADRGNHRIRQVHPTTGVVTTVAGSTMGNVDGTGTNAKFNFPIGIVALSNGNLLVTDSDNHQIRLLTRQ